MKEQRNNVMGVILPLQEVLDNYKDYLPSSRSIGEKVNWYMKRIPSFLDEVEKGKEFTDVELERNYYVGKDFTFTISILKGLVSLYEDIKTYGLKIPIDMYREEYKLVIHDGWRRLLILSKLGYEKVCFRVFRNERLCWKHRFPKKPSSFGPIPSDSIHNIAKGHFARNGYKATNKYWTHNFTNYYDVQLNYLRKKPIRLLEMGVGNGASLLLWKDAFPKAQIYGLTRWNGDWKENLKGQKRIRVFIGQQEDMKFLEEQIIPVGLFDVIIDDAGHKPKQQLAAFNKLWPSLKPGGQYVIEDLQENYWEKNKEGPLTIQFLQKQLAELQDATEKTGVYSIVAYHNICFIRKLFS